VKVQLILILTSRIVIEIVWLVITGLRIWKVASLVAIRIPPLEPSAERKIKMFSYITPRISWQ
jgi:hypothetical protein